MTQRPRASPALAGGSEVILARLAAVADRGEQLAVETPHSRAEVPRGSRPVVSRRAARPEVGSATWRGSSDDHLRGRSVHECGSPDASAARPRRIVPGEQGRFRSGTMPSARSWCGRGVTWAQASIAGARAWPCCVAVAHGEADGDRLSHFLALNAPRRYGYPAARSVSYLVKTPPSRSTIEAAVSGDRVSPLRRRPALAIWRQP